MPLFTSPSVEIFSVASYVLSSVCHGIFRARRQTAVLGGRQNRRSAFAPRAGRLDMLRHMLLYFLRLRQTILSQPHYVRSCHVLFYVDRSLSGWYFERANDAVGMPDRLLLLSGNSSSSLLFVAYTDLYTRIIPAQFRAGILTDTTCRYPVFKQTVCLDKNPDDHRHDRSRISVAISGTGIHREPA